MNIRHMVDILVTINRTKVILIKRAKPPYQDKFVLPGGHVDPEDESLAHAAAREALEEIGLHFSPSALKLLTVLDTPRRDPRYHSVSVVYTVDISVEEADSAMAGSDARELMVMDLQALTSEHMGFDHWNAIAILKST